MQHNLQQETENTTDIHRPELPISESQDLIQDLKNLKIQKTESGDQYVFVNIIDLQQYIKEVIQETYKVYADGYSNIDQQYDQKILGEIDKQLSIRCIQEEIIYLDPSNNMYLKNPILKVKIDELIDEYVKKNLPLANF